MADKLPWFKFYAQDWLTDPRVLSLTNEQRGIYHWLLCRQWHDGDLPGDVMHIYPLLPPGSDSAAVAYVLAMFFPPDPDTTRRSNPTLASQQLELEARHAAQAAGAAHARAVRSRKLRQTKELQRSASSVASRGRSKKEEPEVEDVVDKRIPVSVLTAGRAFFSDSKTRAARVGEVQMLLEGMRGGRFTPEAVARALGDMTATGTAFTPAILKKWAERATKLLDGEAGQRAGREALAGKSSLLRQPDANTGPSEDDFE